MTFNDFMAARAANSDMARKKIALENLDYLNMFDDDVSSAMIRANYGAGTELLPLQDFLNNSHSGNSQSMVSNAPQSGYQISADAPTTAPITDQTKTESQPTTQTDNALDENDKNDIGYWKGLMKSLGDMQQDQMEFNESMTNAQMAWLERMSGTAYQRAMADMKQAGLNPILAYSQGGATTPSVSPNNYSLSGGDTLTDFLSVAVNGIANIMKAISSFLPSQSISKIFSEAVSSSTNTNYNYKMK